jgi:glutamyl-tRNA reductase
MVAEEVAAFLTDWNRRKDGPVIGALTEEVGRIRDEVLGPLLGKLNGKLTDADKALVEAAFRLMGNKMLHGPIAALREASREGHGPGLREALMRLFGLK